MSAETPEPIRWPRWIIHGPPRPAPRGEQLTMVPSGDDRCTRCGGVLSGRGHCLACNPPPAPHPPWTCDEPGCAVCGGAGGGRRDG